MNGFFATCIAGVLCTASGVDAAVLRSAGMTVTINESSGAIDELTIDAEPLNSLKSEGRFGADVNGDFFLNYRHHYFIPFTISQTNSTITATGSFDNLGVTRVYSMHATLPVLSFTTTLTNLSGFFMNVDFFDSFRSRRTSWANSHHVRYSESGDLVSLAYDTRSSATVLGSTAASVVASGGNSRIWDRRTLNIVRTVQPSDGFLDHRLQQLIYTYWIAPGESVTFQTHLAAGMSPGEGLSNYDAAALPPVPLPASLPLMLAGFAGLGMLKRRKRAS